jgi:hypothetical protein
MGERIGEREELVAMTGTQRMYRLVVTYEMGPGGTLLPTSPPIDRVHARGEGLLYRALAKLVSADATTIAAAASRHGPLGPTRETASLADQRRLAWAFGELIGFVVGELDELRRWIAAGGGIAVAIPGRLSRTAHLLIAFAGMDPPMMDRLNWAEESLANATGERLSPDERSRLRPILWRETFAAMARYEQMAGEMAADLARGDEPVHVRVPVGMTADRLRMAATLVGSTFGGLGRDGGAGAVLEPGGLGRMATVLGQYPGVDDLPFTAPETVEAWYGAASELAAWTEAVRLLRARTAGRDGVGQLHAVLATLRGYAGVDGADRASPPSSRAADLSTLRSAAASILTLRLQQVDAWPLPEDEVVGAFARALWSLWGPITGTVPARRCRWRDGCSRWLPPGGHGNLQYCEAHRKQAPRDRARRNRTRRRGRAGATATGSRSEVTGSQA